jgi:hypothetical protein
MNVLFSGKCTIILLIDVKSDIKIGLPGRKKGMDDAVCEDMREIGWNHFLPIDSFPTNRLRPKGLKEMRGNIDPWPITAWRSLATL